MSVSYTHLDVYKRQDTNREHLDRILHKVGSDYKMFRVEKGNISEMVETQVAVSYTHLDVYKRQP